MNTHIYCPITHIEHTTSRQLIGRTTVVSLYSRHNVVNSYFGHLLCHVTGLRKVHQDRSLARRWQGDSYSYRVDVFKRLVTVVTIDWYEALRV